MNFFSKSLATLVLAFSFTAMVSADDFTGNLTAKPASAGKDVVAVLHVGKKADEKKYNLVATGDQAKQIADLIKDKTPVKVSGDVTGDTITVKSVAADETKKKKTK